MRSIWLCILRFAYRRVMRRDTREPLGVPGRRDPDNPCPAYQPGRIKAAGWSCIGDGHHLCRECSRYKPVED